MGDVALFCLLQGDPIERSFRVKMSREDYISDLRKLIITKRANRLQGVDANLLLLYRVSIAHSDEIQQLDLKDTPSLDPRSTIGELFPGIPRKSDFIFVANGMMLRCGLICVSFPNYTFAFPQVVYCLYPSAEGRIHVVVELPRNLLYTN